MLLLWAMWAVMMVGHDAAVRRADALLYDGVAARRRGPAPEPRTQIYALAAGYVAVWALFSVVATGAQRVLSMLIHRLADDDAHESDRGRGAAPGRRHLPADAAQARMPAELPVAA